MKRSEVTVCLTYGHTHTHTECAALEGCVPVCLGRGGYSRTPEPSDMTQMHCATEQRAQRRGRRVAAEENKEGEGLLSVEETLQRLNIHHQTSARLDCQKHVNLTRVCVCV